jgi:hypothetical protein
MVEMTLKIKGLQKVFCSYALIEIGKERKTMMKRGKGLLLCVMFVFAILCRGGVVQAQYENETSGGVGNNYGYEGKMNSYLDVRDDGTISRIEAMGSSKGVLIENYDASFQLLSSKTLSYELPLFGGFYSSDKYYFLVFGDSNKDESDEKEVLRVVKYDKKWNRLGGDSVYGGNTYVMFASAGMDMADDGSLLYIRTGHTMYKSSDGYNHQASVMAEVDMATCTINKCLYGISNVAYGYVSHSFNEKLVYDTDTASLYSSDLGDAYPRYNVVHKYLSIGSSYWSTKTKYLSAMDYGGTTGNNYTGSTLGGLTAGSGNLLVAGSTIDQSNFSTAKSRNVYVTVIDTSSFTKTKTTYFTEYNDGDNEGRVSAPQLVKINDNRFLLLWETASMSGAYSGKINYVYIDANANALSEVQSLEGSIAKCQPVVYQNQVVWYYAKNTSPIFYCLPTDPSKAVDMTLFAKLKNVSKVAVTSSYKLAPKKSMQLSVTFLPEGASAESLTYKSSNPGIAKVSASGKITAGKKAGTTTITVTSENGIKKYFKVKVMKKPVSKIRIKTSKTTIKVNKTVKMKAITSPGKKTASTGVFWKSSNPKVAKVSTSGKVKGVKKGTAKITATATDGSGKKAVIRIKVK